MRNVWRRGAAIALALLLMPIRTQALEARNLFADVTDTLSMRMNEWMAAALEQNVKDLKIALTSDQTRLCAGETAQMQVEILNPRMHAGTVEFQFTLSHESALSVAGGPQAETLFLPAARLTETGEIVPGRVQRTYTVTMNPEAQLDEGLLEITAAASLQEGSRWYQSTQNLTLCMPQISAVLRATNTAPAPQERFFYEVVLTNSGAAQTLTDVSVSLPEGVHFTPDEPEKASADEAAQAMAGVLPETAQVCQGNVVFAQVRVAAATYDEQGNLTAPAQTVLRVPVTVDAQALENMPSAQRVLSCGAEVNGEKLQAERITVCGPVIACTLTPSLRDVEMGGTLYYTCLVENSGYAAADVQVTVQIPEGMKFTRFSTRGQGNRIAGDTLSWVVHLDKPLLNIAGEPEPTSEVITYQVQAQELEEGVRALIVPATAAYQVGSDGKTTLTKTALTTVHRPTVLGLSAEEWGLLCWAGLVLLLTALVLFLLIRRDGEKGD